MLFFPVIMNAIQYYIIDGFIKDQKPSEHEPIPSDDGEDDDDEDGRRTRSRRTSRGLDGVYDSDCDDQAKNDSVKIPTASDKELTPDRIGKSRSDSYKIDEYDPTVDGERGSSSGSSARNRDEPASPPKEPAAKARKI